jgi:hypothetical protein
MSSIIGFQSSCDWPADDISACRLSPTLLGYQIPAYLEVRPSRANPVHVLIYLAQAARSCSEVESELPARYRGPLRARHRLHPYLQTWRLRLT